jgi:hypothetical protein
LAAGRRISCEVAGLRIQSRSKVTPMRKLFSLTMMGVVIMGFGMGLSGCTEESTPKSTPSSPTGKPGEIPTDSIKPGGNAMPPSPKGAP